MIAVDTSVAVPLLVATHSAHRQVAAWARGRELALSGHAAVETYAVLTRLPGDLRVDPADARTLLDEGFDKVAALSRTRAANAHGLLAVHGIAGGAVYDALVALAALEHRLDLATRDARAIPTYQMLAASVVVVPG